MIQSHNTLKPVKCAEHMRAVYHGISAAAHENIFISVCHPDDLVRHNLTDRKNQIIASADKQPIDLHVDGLVDDAIRNLGYELRRHRADFNDILPPVMNQKAILRNSCVQIGNFRSRHRRVRPQRRQNINLCPALRIFPI